MERVCGVSVKREHKEAIRAITISPNQGLWKHHSLVTSTSLMRVNSTWLEKKNCSVSYWRCCPLMGTYRWPKPRIFESFISKALTPTQLSLVHIMVRCLLLHTVNYCRWGMNTKTFPFIIKLYFCQKNVNVWGGIELASILRISTLALTVCGELIKHPPKLKTRSEYAPGLGIHSTWIHLNQTSGFWFLWSSGTVPSQWC